MQQPRHRLRRTCSYAFEKRSSSWQTAVAPKLRPFMFLFCSPYTPVQQTPSPPPSPCKTAEAKAHEEFEAQIHGNKVVLVVSENHRHARKAPAPPGSPSRPPSPYYASCCSGAPYHRSCMQGRRLPENSTVPPVAAVPAFLSVSGIASQPTHLSAMRAKHVSTPCQAGGSPRP